MINELHELVAIFVRFERVGLLSPTLQRLFKRAFFRGDSKSLNAYLKKKKLLDNLAVLEKGEELYREAMPFDDADEDICSGQYSFATTLDGLDVALTDVALSRHVAIAGASGTGKSETIRTMLRAIQEASK